MREIKFRAWVVEEYKEDGNTPETFKMHYWNNYFFSDVSPVTRWSDYFPEINDPCVILMQYTGIKDKNGNGKEIYDGDILKVGYENCIVSWDDICGRWVAKSARYKILGHKFKNGVIIGNIHENPELLEQ